MGALVELTGVEDVASVTPKMLQGVSAAAENKDQVAALLLDAAMRRYGNPDAGRGLFRSVAARANDGQLYTVFVLVGSEVSREVRVEIEKEWAKDAS